MNAPKPILTLASILWTLAAPTPAPAADEPKAPASPPPVLHRTVKVDGLDIFYREAGPVDAPAVLLLHGFPTSSHMYRNLIPALADRYHVVAPDYPGFGHSSAPAGGRVRVHLRQPGEWSSTPSPSRSA